MDRKKSFLTVIIIAVAIKLFLFAFAVIRVPQSKFADVDSTKYWQTAQVLYTRGAFATEGSGGALKYETFRTPGYPVFLSFLHYLLKIPFDWVILFQVLLTICAAFITYRAALTIDRGIAFLSAAVVLFDPPISIFSLMIMAESLSLFGIALFIFSFILYLKNGEISFIILSALLLSLSTYVKPIGYYLGGVIVIFIVYANIPKSFKKSFLHAFVFFIVVYSLLGIWQLRNYERCKKTSFSTVAEANFRQNTLIGSYAGNNDRFSQGLAPVPYYITVTARCLLRFMTSPGSFKYFQNFSLSIVGMIAGYLWMVFWLIGFCMGVVKTRRNIYYQFLVLVIVYFAAVTVISAGWAAKERLRIPIVPAIAMIAAYGWISRSSFMRRHFS